MFIDLVGKVEIKTLGERGVQKHYLVFRIFFIKMYLLLILYRFIFLFCRAITPEKSIEVRVKEELVFDGGGGPAGPAGFWRAANGRGEMRPPRPAAPRPAPTVIMGEAGGVRTMVWSQPTDQQPGPSATAWPVHNQEETAAQLLLTLGKSCPTLTQFCAS